ncbi:MAG: WD40 repeat domain-containing protein [Planctomycetia bacterium]|nr:WD40 repeat domain-containing protein [Planctomycetia bacterium]
MKIIRIIKRFFFLICFSNFVIVIANGCSVSPIHFMKSEKEKAESSDNAEIVDEQHLSTLLNVPGKIVKLELSNLDQHLLVVWESPDSEMLSEDDVPTRASFWNLEHSTACLEKAEELNAVDSVLSVAWNDEANTLFIADKDSQRPLNVNGFRKANVRALSLDSPLMDQVALLPEENDDQNLQMSSNAYWIACQDRNRVWRLIKRSDQRIVQFPEIMIKNEEDKLPRNYIVSDILAFSSQNDLVATVLSVKNESVHSGQTKEHSGQTNLMDNATQRGQTYSIDKTDVVEKTDSVDGVALNDKIGSLEESPYDMIIIWDLQVVDQIEWNDQTEPLQAIEVSRFNVQKGIDSYQCAFSSDGSMFAVRSKSKYIGIWESAKGRLLTELGEHQQPIQSMAFNANNHFLVVGTGKETARLVLWDIRQGKPLRVYQEPTSSSQKITAVTFSENNKDIYFGTEAGAVKIWSIDFFN